MYLLCEARADGNIKLIYLLSHDMRVASELTEGNEGTGGQLSINISQMDWIVQKVGNSFVY